MESQVVSLEVAQELNEKLLSIGLECKSAFNWHRARRSRYNKWKQWSLLEAFHVAIRNNHKGELLDKYIRTYTLDEMFDMLPPYIITDKGTGFLIIKKYKNIAPPPIKYFEIGYETIDENVFYRPKSWYYHLDTEKDNFATTCAKLMCWLIDNNYIKGEPCKNG